MSDAPEKIRVDKWLWQARFFKSRSLAGEAVTRLRINGIPVEKPSQSVRPGDVLTFVKERDVRVIQIEGIGTRRGPAAEAQALYTDLDPPEAREQAPKDTHAERDPGAGRPTKRARRDIDAFRQGDT